MGIVLKEIGKNGKDIIRIEVSEFKGKELINIRIWYPEVDHKKGSIEYKPSQKGISFSINRFNELKDAINRLENYLRDKNNTNNALIINDESSENIEDSFSDYLKGQKGLFKWQREALEKWESGSFHGIIEAVTGSVKPVLP
jgi:hypothetical protein